MTRTLGLCWIAVALLLGSAGLPVGEAAEKPPAAPPSVPAEAGAPAVEPPSPLEAEPPEKSFGRLRISVWAGPAWGDARKDTAALEGDRLSWSDDLGGAPFFAAPSAAVDFKLRRRVYGFLEASGVYQEGAGDAPSGGFAFDGEVFPGGRPVEVSLSRWLFDLGALAWGTVEEAYRVAFCLGARYQILDMRLAVEGGPRVRETSENVFPFVGILGELRLAENLHLEGRARASLFSLSYREVIETEETVIQYVDSTGRPIGSGTVSTRRRYLVTQVNGLLEIAAGIRYDLTPETGIFAAFRFTYMNAERNGDGRREDFEWRALALEAGWEVRF